MYEDRGTYKAGKLVWHPNLMHDKLPLKYVTEQNAEYKGIDGVGAVLAAEMLFVWLFRNVCEKVVST